MVIVKYLTGLFWTVKMIINAQHSEKHQAQNKDVMFVMVAAADGTLNLLNNLRQYR